MVTQERGTNVTPAPNTDRSGVPHAGISVDHRPTSEQPHDRNILPRHVLPFDAALLEVDAAVSLVHKPVVRLSRFMMNSENNHFLKAFHLQPDQLRKYIDKVQWFGHVVDTVVVPNGTSSSGFEHAFSKESIIALGALRHTVGGQEYDQIDWQEAVDKTRERLGDHPVAEALKDVGEGALVEYVASEKKFRPVNPLMNAIQKAERSHEAKGRSYPVFQNHVRRLLVEATGADQQDVYNVVQYVLQHKIVEFKVPSDKEQMSWQIKAVSKDGFLALAGLVAQYMQERHAGQAVVLSPDFVSRVITSLGEHSVASAITVPVIAEKKPTIKEQRGSLGQENGHQIGVNVLTSGSYVEVVPSQTSERQHLPRYDVIIQGKLSQLDADEVTKIITTLTGKDPLDEVPDRLMHPDVQRSIVFISAFLRESHRELDLTRDAYENFFVSKALRDCRALLLHHTSDRLPRPTLDMVMSVVRAEVKKQNGAKPH
jgi:hypothetical protein